MEKIISDKEKIRIDHFLKERFPDYSRGYFQRLIKNAFVKINGSHTESGHKLHLGDIVEIEFKNKEEKILPADIPLKIIFEDNSIIAINKQPGLVVHPAGPHQMDTLVNGLLYYWNSEFSPFLVHRLDRDTSGIIIVAKTESAKDGLSKQFQQRLVEKKYLTIVDGIIKESEGTIETPLGRSKENRKKIIVGPVSEKMSKTFFRVLKRYKNATYLEVKPHTGRTHQIRVHLAYIGHPVTGDTEYGKSSKITLRQLLHASSIKFLHPVKKKRIEFSAPLPDDFKLALESLRKQGKND